MQKKFLGVGIVSALSFALLSGCGSDDDKTINSVVTPPEKTPAAVTLTFLDRYSTYDAFAESAAEIPAYDSVSKHGFVVNAKAGIVDVLTFDSATGKPTLYSTISLDGIAPAGVILEVNSVAVKNGLVAVAIQNKVKTESGYVAIYNARTLARLASAELKDGDKNGALPDMVTFTPDGKTVLLALEGEPSDDYQTDPEGGIAVVDVSGVSRSSTLTVKIADFRAWNAGGSKTLPANVRIYGQKTSGGVVTHSTVAQDLEPEYIAVSADGKTAWVTLQENNALAILDIATATVKDIKALGFKDYGLSDSGFANAHGDGNSGNGIDPSDTPAEIKIAPQSNVRGMYQPDSIAAYTVAGKTWLVTANEGDARAWGEKDTDYWKFSAVSSDNGASAKTASSKGFVEEFRVKHLVHKDGFDRRRNDDLPPQLALLAGGALLNPDNFAWCGAIKGDPKKCRDDDKLGRLNISWVMGYQKKADGSPVLYKKNGDLADGTTPFADTRLMYDQLYSYGARSFSIWDESGSLVWDSGDSIEKFLASDDCKLKADRSLACKTFFNSGHDEGNAFDSRSDAKGPEPEGLAIGKIGNKTFVFVGLERMGGVLVYDITDPSKPVFQDYLNTREEWVAAPNAGNLNGYGDLGPEGLVFIPAAQSPTGKPLVVVGNEVSGSTAVFEVRQTF